MDHPSNHLLPARDTEPTGHAMASSCPPRAAKAAFATLLLAAVAACGGGGGDAPAPAPAPAPAATAAAINRVVVAGDSLADVGTFGLKATVQSASQPTVGYPLYPELVASALGLGPLCNHYSSSDQLRFDTRAACTDFAVAGSQVVNPVTRGGSALPYSLEKQLQDAVAASGGSWRAGDLLVIDAGSNDAASVADGYRNARNGGADAAVYAALLAQQLSASAINDALAQADGGSVAAGLYLRQVARTYWATVRAATLDKGATRVAMLDVPDLSLTPRFRSIAAGIAATDGQAEADAFLAALRGWIAGFNAELATWAAGEPRVVLVKYSADFSAQAATPSAYGLTNVTQQACPPGDFTACTDAALDASPPAGLQAGWWKTWYYSDAFHPTPRGHELLAATVNRALAQAGWR